MWQAVPFQPWGPAVSVPAADNLRDASFVIGGWGQREVVPAINAAADLLEAIEALHQPTRAEDGAAGEYHYCQGCCMDWPCPTARLLHSEVQP